MLPGEIMLGILQCKNIIKILLENNKKKTSDKYVELTYLAVWTSVIPVRHQKKSLFPRTEANCLPVGLKD